MHICSPTIYGIKLCLPYQYGKFPMGQYLHVGAQRISQIMKWKDVEYSNCDWY